MSRKQKLTTTVLVAIALVVIVGARAHELLGFLAKLRPALLSCIAAVALVIYKTPFRRIKEAIVGDRAVTLVFVLFGWAYVCLPFALYKGLAFKSLVTPSFMLVTLVTTVLLCPPNRTVQRWLQWAFVSGVAFHLMLLQSKGYMFRGRMYTAAGGLDPNDYAAMASMMTPLALGLLQREKGIWKMVALGLTGVLLIALVRTGSRGGVVAFLGAMLVFVFYSGGARRFTYLGIFVIMATIGWGVSAPQFKQRLIDLAEGKEDYNTTAYTGRKQIWARARGYIIARPIFGVGIGNFPIMEGDFLKSIGETGKWSAAHNAYYQVGVELGVLGGVLFISIIGLTARRGITLRSAFRQEGSGRIEIRPDYVSATASFALSSVFLSHAYFYLFYGFVAFVAYTYRAALAEAMMRAPTQPSQLPLPTAPPMGGEGPSSASAPMAAMQRARSGSGWRSAASSQRVVRKPDR